MIECYLALGGNLKGSLQAMQNTATSLKNQEGIKNLKVSKLYQTSPVSPIPQSDYLNAVCKFDTEYSLEFLWDLIQGMEQQLGKQAKAKESPRLIDLDLLFYGSLRWTGKDLTVPHPRWQERLFVLAPLADVTERLPTGQKIKSMVELFLDPHQKIAVLKENWL